MPNDLTLNNDRTAVLVMDYQNDIVEPYLGDQAPATLNRVNNLLDTARGAGVPVIYVAVRFRPGHPEVARRNPLFGDIAENNGLVEGTPGAEIHDDLAPQGDDVVVTKKRVSAFAGSDLDNVLRGLDIETMVLAGIATSGVVLSTVCEGADRDYRCVVVEDCCVDADEETHRVLVENVFPMRAYVMNSEDVRSELQT